LFYRKCTVQFRLYLVFVDQFKYIVLSKLQLSVHFFHRFLKHAPNLWIMW